MRNFANIGKSVLTKALGLQKNYVEIVDKVIEIVDEEKSGCANCKWYKLKSVIDENDDLHKSCVEACENCPNRCMKTQNIYKKVYHNEKNMYGYLPRLKTNAIKLFLSYHMLEMDNNGIVMNVDLKKQAKILDCDIKTIKNNNRILKDYGYICYTEIDNNIINLYVPAYEEYFKPASVGGRGFLVLSKTTFEEILKIESLNELRLTLRQLMEFDILNNKNVDSIEKSYKELRRVLPDYCKRNIIQKVSSNLSMFVTEIKDNIVKFVIKPEYNSKKVKEDTIESYKDDISNFIKEFNNDAVLVNNSTFDYNDSKYADFFGKEHDWYRVIMFNELEIEDLASLCLQYSLNVVIKALSSIYKTYYLRGDKPHNLGGLTRTVILSNFAAA